MMLAKRTLKPLSAFALILFITESVVAARNIHFQHNGREHEVSSIDNGHRRLSENSGGAFKMLGGVWLDSASARTSGIESDCIKSAGKSTSTYKTSKTSGAGTSGKGTSGKGTGTSSKGASTSGKGTSTSGKASSSSGNAGTSKKTGKGPSKGKYCDGSPSGSDGLPPSGPTMAPAPFVPVPTPPLSPSVPTIGALPTIPSLPVLLRPTISPATPTIPTAPDGGVPTTPDGGVPTAPDGGVPTAPDGGAPTAPDGGVPTAPDGSVPTAPDGGVPTAPDGSVPTAPDGSVPTAPDGGVPTAPDGSVPTAPDGGVPTAPDGSVPTAPDGGVPTAPDGGVPTAPDGGVPTAPDGGVPTAPDGGVPTAPDGGVPTAPDGSVPTTPDGGVPTAPDGGVPTAPDGGVPTAPDVGVPTMAPAPSMPSPPSPVAGPVPTPAPTLTPCELYLTGQAPTSAPSQSVSIDIALAVNATANPNDVLSDFLDFLNDEIGPLLVCADQQRRRSLQEDTTTIVNLIFDQLSVDPSVSCDSVDASQTGVACLPTNLQSILYYFGEYPVGFAAALRAAILNAIRNITGLIGISDVIVTTDAAPTAAPVIFTPSKSPTVVPTLSEALETNSPTPAPANDVSGIEGPSDRSVNSGLSTTGSVALAVAGLTILLAIIFAISRRRESDSDDIIKHRQFTDDEDDGSYNRDLLEGGTVIMTPDRLVSVVGDNDSQDSDRDAMQEQPLYAIHKLGQEPLSLTEMHALEGHSCSSPTCEICELKRQSGVNFIPASDHPFDKHTTHGVTDATRKYAAADTVAL